MKASRDKDRSQHADGELKERRIYRERESVPKESEREIEGKKEIGVVTKKTAERETFSRGGVCGAETASPRLLLFYPLAPVRTQR